tara:strand:- start:796 stop:918 length:123 start_codon:yes stop_codon:yes gene_type:complete
MGHHSFAIKKFIKTVTFLSAKQGLNKTLIPAALFTRLLTL